MLASGMSQLRCQFRLLEKMQDPLGEAIHVGVGRNPSGAIVLASTLTPFLTFFVITSFLVGNFGTVFLVIAATYGFATWAMLVPAIDVFDVATARASAREE